MASVTGWTLCLPKAIKERGNWNAGIVALYALMHFLQGETPLDLAKQRKNVWMINHLQEARQAKGYDSPSYLKRLKMDKVHNRTQARRAASFSGYTLYTIHNWWFWGLSEDSYMTCDLCCIHSSTPFGFSWHKPVLTSPACSAVNFDPVAKA